MDKFNTFMSKSRKTFIVLNLIAFALMVWDQVWWIAGLNAFAVVINSVSLYRENKKRKQHELIKKNIQEFIDNSITDLKATKVEYSDFKTIYQAILDAKKALDRPEDK